MNSTVRSLEFRALTSVVFVNTLMAFFAFHLDFVVARSCSTLFGLLAAVSKVAMMNESNFTELIFYVATVALAVDVVSRNDADF